MAFEIEVVHGIAGGHFLPKLKLFITPVETPRPHVVRRADVCRPSKIPEHPHGRPQAANIALPRQPGPDLHDASRKAELVPPLKHCGLVILCHLSTRAFGVQLGLEGHIFNDGLNLQRTIPGLGEVSVIKLQGVVRVVVLMNSRPSRVIAIPKCPPVHVKLVTEDQIVSLTRALTRYPV